MSSNWLIKRTIDKISLNYTFNQWKNSTYQIKNEIKNRIEYDASYSYKWGKDNYIMPFNFIL